MTVPMRIRRHRRRSPTSAAARRFTTTRWRFALDSKRQFLRHTLATLAYRGGKVVHDAPENFSEFSAGHRTRTAGNILAHICDLLDWACSMARGTQTWKYVPPRSWTEDVDRFFAGLKRLDSLLADDQPLGFEAEKLFQGPIADALTHVGQLAILRRMASAPVKGENYFKSDIAAGRVGPEQSAPLREFDRDDESVRVAAAVPRRRLLRDAL